MPVLQDTDTVKLNNPEFYNAWKGQMFIQDQLVCDIALQSSEKCGIPTQLSDKLEIREVIRLSALKQKLPESIFEKAEFTGQEVCCGDIYYSIYKVIISNVVGSDLDKLQKWMKDQELAIVKFLNDQGFLILVTSSILKTSKGLKESDSTCFTAVFLFPHEKSLDTKGSEKWEKDFPREEISIQVTALLPGLQYAIMETHRSLKEKELCPDALEKCFQKFAILQKKKDSSPEDKGALPILTEVPHDDSENRIPEKCSQMAFERLQSYISAPVNYCVPVVKASKLLAGEPPCSAEVSNSGEELTSALQSKLSLEDGSKVLLQIAITDGSNEKELLQENAKPTPKPVTTGKGPKKRMKRGKRRRMLTAVKAVKQYQKKREMMINSGDHIQPFPENRTTLKLASVQCSQGRKRGAEVLTAEFIQEMKPELPQKRTPIKRKRRESKNLAPSRRSERTPKKRTQEVPIEPGKPPKRKALNLDNISEDKTTTETSETPAEKKIRKPRKVMDGFKIIKKTGQGKSFSKNVDKVAEKAVIQEDNILEKRMNMYESHALNLLADLALNSFTSSSIPFAQGDSVSEQVGIAENDGAKQSTVHEYPMVRKPETKHVPISAPASPLPQEPIQTPKPSEHLPGPITELCDKENSLQSTKEIRKKIKSPKSPAMYPKMPVDQVTKISMEHSYSQLSANFATPVPVPSKPEESAIETVPEPKVLPPVPEVVIQPQQQPNTIYIPGDFIFLTSNQVLPLVQYEARSVLKLGDKFLITFNREPTYDFDLDSKFTSEPLEKTINRALHGPWNPNLKEKVEDVKIILHMWLALFYSKTNKQLNRRTRKVVEHSNPAKYVSINTALDPFELYKFVESESMNIGLTPLPPCSSSHSTGVILPFGNAIRSPYPGKLPLPALPRPPRPEKVQNKNPPGSRERKKDREAKASSAKNLQSAATTNKTATASPAGKLPKDGEVTESKEGCIPIVCYMSDGKHPTPGDTGVNGNAAIAETAKPLSEKANAGESFIEVSSTSVIQDVMDHEFDTCQEIVMCHETSDESKEQSGVHDGSQLDMEVGPLHDQLVSSTRPYIEPDKEAWLTQGISDLSMESHTPPLIEIYNSENSSDGYATPLRSDTTLSVSPGLDGKSPGPGAVMASAPVIDIGSSSYIPCSNTSTPYHTPRHTPETFATPEVEEIERETYISGIDLTLAPESGALYKMPDIATSGALEAPKASLSLGNTALSQTGDTEVILIGQTDISIKTNMGNVSMATGSTYPKVNGLEHKIQTISTGHTDSLPSDGEEVRLAALENKEHSPAVVVELVGEKESQTLLSLSSALKFSAGGIVDFSGNSRDAQTGSSLLPESYGKSPVSLTQVSMDVVSLSSNEQYDDDIEFVVHDKTIPSSNDMSQPSVGLDGLNEKANSQSAVENVAPALIEKSDSKETGSYEQNQKLSQPESLKEINNVSYLLHGVKKTEMDLLQVTTASLHHGHQICSIPDEDTANDKLNAVEMLPKNALDKVMKCTSPEDKMSHLLHKCEVVILDSNSSHSSEDALEESDRLSIQRSCTPSIQDLFTEDTNTVSTQEPSDICLIANIASISEEQYESLADEDMSQVNKNIQKVFSDQEYSHVLSRSTSESTVLTYTTKLKGSKCSQRRSSSRSRLRDTDEYFQRYHRESDYHSSRKYGNFTVTKNLKDSGRHREDNLLTNKRMCSGDLTQNTVDLEHLRFIHRLKRVLRNTSSDDFFYERPYKTMFESRRIPGSSSSSSKNTSPLLITVQCSEGRRGPRVRDRWYSGSYYTQRYYDDELMDRPVYYSRTPKKARCHSRRAVSPFHFSHLMYENNQEEPDSDISLILNDCVQSNHVRLSRVGVGNTKIDWITARDLAEDTIKARTTTAPSSKDSHVVKNIISDHCSNLQSRLSNVAKESGKRNFRFYISETSDDPFFTLTKNLLKKDGHTPMEPQHFCHSQHDSETLLVIIRNEDISSHVHKIPCLLQLKLSPNVTFAGVDNPEDVMESTYEELFQAGGFVMSEPSLLENITLVKLKEVLTVLEKMNKSSSWKWLVHYRENKRLKEDKRVESVSQVKIPLLKSYQQMNIIEVLPYHQCDSTKDPAEDRSCTLTLQSQHVLSRLAVYLTDKPSPAREEMEQNGILVFDVDTFIKSVQKLDARFQMSNWP
ncbi:protein TASOR 2 isoform 2-T2 [Discoglossus pictus]